MSLSDMRKAVGLSLHKLAADTDVPLSSITAWEAWEAGRKTKTARNPRLMRLDTAARMADALNVELGEFYGNLDGANCNAFVDLMEPYNEVLKWPENASRAGLCFHIRIFDGRIDFEAMRYEEPDNEIDCLDLNPDDWESEFDGDIAKVLHANGYRLASGIREDGDLLLFDCVK